MNKRAELVRDAAYAVKLVRGIASGFDGLQQREYADMWESISRGADGEYEVGDSPYYVCARWEDGSRTPLPIVLYGGAGLQGFVVEVLRVFHNEAFESAARACEEYEAAYTAAFDAAYAGWADALDW